ncbi:LBH domain-containing protein 1 isoform X2 [Macaca thibetana thibetana]|uniref:LBH domain-containing protein 1 isoform X2 n=1 Tax=Macaca thibetana thibetana TaxID=257877 RepID=UPI0021BCF048|nr:LBH domain-containing protein 1 isoform X2 [Macaca thibetana thibetana]
MAACTTSRAPTGVHRSREQYPRGLTAPSRRLERPIAETIDKRPAREDPLKETFRIRSAGISVGARAVLCGFLQSPARFQHSEWRSYTYISLSIPSTLEQTLKVKCTGWRNGISLKSPICCLLWWKPLR